MTNYVDRYWAKWEQNIAPVITQEAEEERNLSRRRNTIKMMEDDPDEVKNSPRFSKAAN